MTIGLAIFGMIVAAFLGALAVAMCSAAGHDDLWKQLTVARTDCMSANLERHSLRRELATEFSNTRYWIDNYKKLHADWERLNATGSEDADCEAHKE